MSNSEENNIIYDAVIIGGGPAGMMAAVSMAEKGLKVLIVEKNMLLGRKLRITGKGRCNITNDCDFDQFVKNIISGNKFILSSLRKFSNRDLMDYFNDNGLETVTERGGRVFPATQKAYDVAEFFVKRLKELKVPVLFGFKACKLIIVDGQIAGVEGVEDTGNCKVKKLYSKNVLISTGGCTYKGTGSDGSGYRLAVQAGHSVVSPKTSLIALKCLEKGECASMQGLTLKNTGIALYEANKRIFEDFGELMFTDRGITGPTVLSLSRFYISALSSKADSKIKNMAELDKYLSVFSNDIVVSGSYERFSISVDLKPALSAEMLDSRIVRDFEKYRQKHFKNSLSDLLPSSMIPVIVSRSGIDPDKTVSNISKIERRQLVSVLKNFVLTPDGPDDPDHGIVTQGGVCLNEIDPSTLESKLVKGLYFAGEVLDIDGLTGGYNLTIAFSTGRAAGNAIFRSLSDSGQIRSDSFGSRLKLPC